MKSAIENRFNKHPNDVLQVLSLGGWGNVNQNLFVYETPKDIMLLDCGVSFPDDPDSEIDVLVPDVDYLKQKKDKIRGVLISHGHLDHYGALPYVLSEIGNPPVWANRLVQGFIEADFADLDLPKPRFQMIRSDCQSFRIGSFEVYPFLVNHSVPESLGFCIKTSVGQIFHVSDYKFDLTPVDGRVFDINRASGLAGAGVLALFSDCLGSVHPGFTSSEREIENILDQIIGQAEGQVLVTTLSSNISRFQQAIGVSLRHGRQVVFLGRSVEEKIKIARQLGYLRLKNQHIVQLHKAKKMPQEKLTYLVSGSYGQMNSALGKIASGVHRQVKLDQGAVVVFSADPAPPGTHETVDTLVDQLTLRGASVHYYEIQENLHVSGHGSANDIRLLMSIVKPKYFVPIGGNPRHVRAYSYLAEEMGAQSHQVLELFGGEVLRLTPNQVTVAGKITLKQRAYKKS